MLWSASCECGGAAGQRAAGASMQLGAASRESGARARTGERPAPALLHDKVEVLHVQAHGPLHIILLQSKARCALTRAAFPGVGEARGCRPRTTASKSCDSNVAMRRRRSSAALLSYCVARACRSCAAPVCILPTPGDQRMARRRWNMPWRIWARRARWQARWGRTHGGAARRAPGAAHVSRSVCTSYEAC
jgi:hypothetical protein